MKYQYFLDKFLQKKKKIAEQQAEIENLKKKLDEMRTNYKYLECEKKQEEVKLKNTIAKLRSMHKESFKVIFQISKNY